MAIGSVWVEEVTEQGLQRFVSLNADRLATMVPISPDFEAAGCTLVPGCGYVLSRFAYLRRDQGEMVLESPLSLARIRLHDWRAGALVHLVTQPRRPEEVTAAIPELPGEAATGLMNLLMSAGMLDALNGKGALDAEDPSLRSWEFHDLLFHTRSRKGRQDGPLGGTYRFLGKLDPPPVLKPKAAVPVIELYQPDLDRLEREDPPFTKVQEARCSIRDYAETPISARQLGEFLYRVGRVADYWETRIPTADRLLWLEFAARPYPASGALYELELYPVIHQCEGLVSGLYHYDPELHQLEQLSGRTDEVERLLRDASMSTAIPRENLQVLFVIGARFQRISWKYASIAYSLILKNVGVLYQTMYLAATAMGLAPCGVGCGDSDLFARAAGTDYYAETSVGEFLLGSKG